MAHCGPWRGDRREDRRENAVEEAADLAGSKLISASPKDQSNFFAQHDRYSLAIIYSSAIFSTILQALARA